MDLHASNFKERFVAYFDILGFSDLVNDSNGDISKQILINKYKEIIEKSEKEVLEINSFSENRMKHVWFSDTFIFFTEGGEGIDYRAIITCSQFFIKNMLYINEPLRGAISYGELYADTSKNIFVGKALIEAYKEAESQNWIGLILSPSATRRTRTLNLEPIRHAFAKTEIPRKPELIDKIATSPERLAYTFCNGSSNRESPVINRLNELMKCSKSEHQIKYQNTIDHIRKYHREI